MFLNLYNNEKYASDNNYNYTLEFNSQIFETTF